MITENGEAAETTGLNTSKAAFTVLASSTAAVALTTSLQRSDIEEAVKAEHPLKNVGIIAKSVQIAQRNRSIVRAMNRKGTFLDTSDRNALR
ncbi:hypothetical protein [Nitrosovibrio sp. Nv4]|nr:hypothetical protein [Nitrosovibrio sp. Nv4]